GPACRKRAPHAGARDLRRRDPDAASASPALSMADLRPGPPATGRCATPTRPEHARARCPTFASFGAAPRREPRGQRRRGTRNRRLSRLWGDAVNTSRRRKSMADTPIERPGDLSTSSLTRRRLLINAGVLAGGVMLAGPLAACGGTSTATSGGTPKRSEEHTSELQSRGHLVCRLLLEKKKMIEINPAPMVGDVA